ncbi:RNA polymerase sigma factor [Blastopirellula marina]|uniref:RNA polymerase sigma factor n=1 Tax=Blastopirellula marina TaxID=124 RepID=A0A2S8GG46_9BACT|nr:RNA polymerase sigma factor [Blastopirellula marina]PQO30180.1 RNA polymerase sigma factor [Blastopirellula marina]PQO43231.1 RNA polymerase sigma factor [Blastopirellula marina]PTL42618.1 RNA polymerase sigma factor [Blastopirellula marina]
MKIRGLDVENLTSLYFDRIHRAALLMCGNAWDADDLAQEVFLIVANDPTKFEGRSSPYTYLYGILLNLERRLRRKRRMHQEKTEKLAQRQDGPAAAVAADVPVVSEEWKRSLWSLASELPDGQRQAIVLRFGEELPYQEIADILGCPLGTVKSRIFHGLGTLRKLVAESPGQLREIPRELGDSPFGDSRSDAI